MKILVDENLPLRLPKELADLFVNVDHASKLGLKSKPDSEIWRFAVSQGYTAILTADADLQSRVLELGSPPQGNPNRALRFLRKGNCGSPSAGSGQNS
jgi:predicted nuclease of predicted toxin-antitoxin system